MCEWKTEPVGPQAAGHSFKGVRNKNILIAHPTRDAIGLMAAHFGYEVEEFDWIALIRKMNIEYDANKRHSATNPLGDYAGRRRATFRLSKTA